MILGALSYPDNSLELLDVLALFSYTLTKRAMLGYGRIIELPLCDVVVWLGLP